MSSNVIIYVVVGVLVAAFVAIGMNTYLIFSLINFINGTLIRLE